MVGLRRALYDRLWRSGPSEDKDSTIGVGEAAVAATPRDQPGRLRRLETSSEGFLERFDGRGAFENIQYEILI